MRSAVALAIALVISSAACANLGEYVWINEYRDPHPPGTANSYILGAGDVIQVRVYNQDGMSARAKVRTDGKITLPFLNDVQVEGYTPNVLAEQLETRLKDFVNRPVVTVSVEEQRHIQVPVVGEVSKSGIIDIPADSGMLQALATAGGLSEMAHTDRIFVLRNDGSQASRIRFDYKKILHAVPPESTFRIRAGDQIVVE
jgi:polysaccharide export outer membrane protein